MNDIKKKSIAIGWRFAVFGLVVTLVQLGIQQLATHMYPDWVASNNGLVSLILIVVSVDLIGFPLIYLLTRNISAARLEKHSMTFGQFAICVFMCAGLCFVGSVIGNIFHAAVTMPFGIEFGEENELAEIMMNSNPWVRILVVGILAPVFEELIFRKILVDHMAPYSKFGAILMSGLMFGLFHGNFQQAFFAALLGMFFAYIYIRTGKITYTILFHMIININSAAIVMYLLQKYSEAALTIDMSLSQEELAQQAITVLPSMLMYIGWLIIMLGFGITGIILLIVKKSKFTLPQQDGENLKKKDVAKAALCNWGIVSFYLLCAGLFVLYYVKMIMAV